jgi:aromatic-L-amino-acid decarboxylase
VSLLDRQAILDSLSRVIGEAWASFDRPRPEEPLLDPELERALAAPMPEAPGDADAALADAARVLDASVSPARPLNLAYVGATALEIGMVGDALAATYDVNLAVTARGADLVERQAIEWLGAFVGYPVAEGVFTSGGMTSNLTALVAAREAAQPGAREDGVDSGRLAVFCSEEAHHSVVRAVEVIGLGRKAVRLISMDEGHRMRPEELDEALTAARAAGVTPMAVIATAGTTLTGAVDPLDAIADVCERHGVWLHVDGAYGGPAAATDSAGPLFAGLARADSLTIDAHKWLGVPKACSVVMLRRAGALQDAFGHEERYMLHHDDVVNAVDRTLEYSRPFRSLKLWLAFRVHGAARLRAWIEGTLGHARTFAELVRADPSFELVSTPTLSTVCLRHVPPGVDDLDEHNIRLTEAIQRDGRVYLASAAVDDRVCLRVCFVNFRTEDDEIPYALDVIRELGASVVPARY